MNPPDTTNVTRVSEIAGETASVATVEEQVFRAGVRFDPVKTGLPLNVESQCLECERILPGMMVWKCGDVFLEKNCPEHGRMEEKLEDKLFTQAEEPARTYSGSRINPVVRHLPKSVDTLCPECGRNVATLTRHPSPTMIWQANTGTPAERDDS